ncbi:MAG: potassium transporter TrkA [Epsilonproteobacteria bacterium]|nr:potassium transporter TrkA [Campylobacterota bacterium]
MTKESTVLIFGYNKYAKEIANSVRKSYQNVVFYTKNIDDSLEVDNGDIVKTFDFTDDWEELEKDINIEESLVFCTMSDEAENVFLTISLRAHFETLLIVALATNRESEHKLKMAGANKVIPIVETTADIITNMIEKPISNKVLHDILYSDNALKVAQIEVENAEIFNGEFPADIDWSRYRGILVLSIMHKDLSTEFIYSSKAKRKPLENGDILIVVGYEPDIKEFENLIGSRKYVSWSNWRW